MPTFDKPDQPGTNGYYGGGALTPASRWTNQNYVDDLKDEIKGLRTERDTLAHENGLLRSYVQRLEQAFSTHLLATLRDEEKVNHLFEQDR